MKKEFIAILLCTVLAIILVMTMNSCKKEDRCHTCTVYTMWETSTGKQETFCGKEKDYEAWQKEMESKGKPVRRCD